MTLKLRPYQNDAVQAVLRHWQNGRGMRRPLLCLATGAGKTIIFSSIIRHFSQYQVRSLVLVHRQELALQAVEKLRYVYPEAEVGIVKGQVNQPDAQVVVASVQTLMRPHRLQRVLERGPFRLVVTDEAHHYAAAEFRRVLDGLGVFAANGPLTVGVTATPQRSDNLSLGTVFEEIVYSRTMLQMIREGYLCNLRGIRIETDLNLDAVHVRNRVGGDGRDYDLQELAQVVNTPAFNQLVVNTFRRVAAKLQTVVFACSIAHAEDLADRFRLAGFKAAVVHGQLPSDKRQQLLKDFHDKKLQILCNMNVLTEGYDEPTIEALFLARPTQSMGLYTQMVGRGTRLYPGKTECLVVDFVDNSSMGLQTLPVLFGLKPDDLKRHKGSVAEAALAVEKQERLPLGKGLRWSETGVNLFERAKLRWLPVDEEAMVLLGGDAGNVFLVRTESGQHRAVLLKDGLVQDLTPYPMPLAYASGIAEDHLRHARATGLSREDAPWRLQAASESQLEQLRRYRVPVTEGMSKGEASDALTVLYARRDLMVVRNTSGATSPPAPKPSGLGLPVPRRRAEG